MSLDGIFPIDKWDFLSKMIPKAIGAHEWKRFMSKAREEQYKKGEIIFREGGTPSGIYYIDSGIVKKYKIDSAGREHIFYVAGRGEFFGYHAILAEERYSDSAAALQNCTVCFVTSLDFFSLLSSSPRLSRQLLKTLSHEFSVFTNNLTVVAQKPVRERVFISLIVLREKFKHMTVKGRPTYIKVSRNDIANMVGTTRENVTRVLAELKREKIIITEGRRIEITDVRALARLANFSE